MKLQAAERGWLFIGIAMLSCLVVFAFVSRMSPIRGVAPVTVERADAGIDASSPPGAAAGPRHVLHVGFELPPVGEDASRWVLWVPRKPVDAVQLRRGDWHSEVESFFGPQEQGDLLPAGFRFPLPSGWEGRIELEMSFASSVPALLKPELMRESRVLQAEQYGAMMASAVYSSLFILALLALSLYVAARDRAFLAFCAYALVALLSLMVVNGHVYQFPGGRLLAFWQQAGLLCFSFVLTAAWLQMVLLYSGLGSVAPRLKRAVDIFCAALLLLAVASLAKWQAAAPALTWLMNAAWGMGALAGLGIMADAGRRGVYMGWVIFAMALLSIAAAIVLSYFPDSGGGWDPVVMRYAYQFGITFGALILAIGFVGRISEYRDQRDSDRMAREDTERRMLQEAARSGLAGELQSQLRALGSRELETTALRLLIDHLAPIIPTHRLAVVMHTHQGRDILLVEPESERTALEQQVAAQALALRRLCASGLPTQQAATMAAMPHWVGMEAAVPLKVQSPAWGVVLLRRVGMDGFNEDEMTFVGDLGRLAVLHMDHAIASANLRRSAEVDVLTGSLNRRTIDQWLQRAFAEAERDGDPLSVLFIDLDHFKTINDRHGHACGDACLRALSKALRGALPEGGVLGRYGGDEFIAIVAGSGGAAARVIGERMRVSAENLQIEWEGQVLRPSVSVGIATRHESESTPAATLDRADKALYAAKRSGRNCVQVAPAVFS